MKTEINVMKIAELAKLNIEKEKLEDFEHDMKEIVAFAEILSEIEDTAVSSLEELPEDSSCSLREDIPEDRYNGASLISASEETEGSYICVPKVIE